MFKRSLVCILVAALIWSGLFILPHLHQPIVVTHTIEIYSTR